MEEFLLSLEGDYVRIHFSDASVQHDVRTMHKRSFCKSQVLSRLLSSMDEDTVVASHAPAGALSAWVNVLGMNELKSLSDPNVVVASLKAADFFDDSDTFQNLCEVLCQILQRLCELGKKGQSLRSCATSCRTRHTRKRRRDVDSPQVVHDEGTRSIFQILDQLPEHLTISVLQSHASFSIRDMLLHLPESHHRLAIQARFPTITQEHRLHVTPTSISPPEHQERVLTRLFTAVSSQPALTSLQSLRVDECWSTPLMPSLMSHSVCIAFDSMLQSVQHLTSLCLGHGDTSNARIQSECSGNGAQCCQLLPSVAHVLARRLPELTSLRHLSLEGDCSTPQAWQALLEGLQSCSNVQCLTLKHVEVVSRGSDLIKAHRSISTDCELVDSLDSIMIADHEERGSPSPKSYVLTHPHKHATRYQQAAFMRTKGAKTALYQTTSCTGVWAFGAALSCMPGLQSLTISHALLDQATLQPLNQALGRAKAHGSSVLQHLTMLSLRGSSCQGAAPGVDPATSRNLQNLAAMLACMPALEHIDLFRCGLTASRIGLLAPAFKSLDQLKYIDVGENELGYSGVAQLCSAWRGLKHVQTLKMDCVLWGGPAFDERTDGAAVLALSDAIQQFSQLQHLSLGRFGVASDTNDVYAGPFLEALGQLSALQTISLRCIGWSPSSMSDLAVVLGNHKQLSSLVLDAYNHVSHVDCSKQLLGFALGLSSLTSLTKLEIHCRANVCALLPELASLTGLKELDLKRLQLQGAMECSAVDPTLSELTALQKLSIMQPCLMTKNAVHFAPALGGLTQLTELVLDIDSRPPAIPQEVLENIQRDYVIDTGGCGIATIAEEIAKLPLLKVLDIGDKGRKLENSELYAVSRELSMSDRHLAVFNGEQWKPWCFDEWWDDVYSGNE